VYLAVFTNSGFFDYEFLETVIIPILKYACITICFFVLLHDLTCFLVLIVFTLSAECVYDFLWYLVCALQHVLHSLMK